LVKRARRGAARCMAVSGEAARLILKHPAVTQETRERIASLEEALAGELPPTTVAAAQAYAEDRTLERMVVETLGNLPIRVG
jgi:hypothetical protein